MGSDSEPDACLYGPPPLDEPDEPAATAKSLLDTLAIDGVAANVRRSLRCADVADERIEIWGTILDYFFITTRLDRARWPVVPPPKSHRQPAGGDLLQ